MFSTTRKTFVTLAAIAGAAAGGAALAGAATSGSSSSASSSSSSTASQRPARGPHDELTGDTAAKVTAAAEKKVPGATVLRVESGRHGAKYHAHVRKSDGTEVVVLVNSKFEATSVKEHEPR